MTKPTGNPIGRPRGPAVDLNPKIVVAIEKLARGEVRTAAQAAKIAGVTPGWMQTILHRPAVREMLLASIRQEVVTAATGAPGALRRALYSEEGAVAVSAAKALLKAVGAAGDQGKVAVQINNTVFNPSTGWTIETVAQRHTFEAELEKAVAEGAQLPADYVIDLAPDEIEALAESDEGDDDDLDEGDEGEGDEGEGDEGGEEAMDGLSPEEAAELEALVS
jgi:hypothetical protein